MRHTRLVHILSYNNITSISHYIYKYILCIAKIGVQFSQTIYTKKKLVYNGCIDRICTETTTRLRHRIISHIQYYTYVCEYCIFLLLFGSKLATLHWTDNWLRAPIHRHGITPNAHSRMCPSRIRIIVKSYKRNSCSHQFTTTTFADATECKVTNKLSVYAE